MEGSKVVIKGIPKLLSRSAVVKYVALSLKGMTGEDVSRDGYFLFLNWLVMNLMVDKY